MPQHVSEQEEYAECSIIQDDHKMPAVDIETDSTDIQLNKEANNLPIQTATEFHTVSNLWKFVHFNKYTRYLLSTILIFNT